MPAYDMQNEAWNTSGKWKGLLCSALKKVQKQVQPSLTIDNESVEYLEELIIQLLYLLCAVQPHGITSVEERVQKTFPQQINDWAINFAQSTIDKGKKKKNALTLPVDKIHPFLQKDVLGYKVEYNVSIYIVAILEYISADILKLAGNYVKNIRHQEITCQDVKVAMRADKVLMDMFHGDDNEPSFEPSIEPLVKRGSIAYEDVLRDFLMSEEQYLRELNILIKVFRKPFEDAPELFTEEDTDSIFSNIVDIYENTVQFNGMVEAAVEIAGEDSQGQSRPLIGDCFEEMSEAAELECYETYALDIISSDPRNCVAQRIKELISQRNVAGYFKSRNIKEAVQYILPKLLYGPIFHCMEYFEYMKLMMTTSPDGEDREKIDESLSALRGLQVSLERICSNHIAKRKPEDKIFYQRRIGTGTHSSISKLNEIQRNIDGWEGKDICQCCSELLKEGQLWKVGQSGRKGPTDRHVFLFDSLIVCVKQLVSETINFFPYHSPFVYLKNTRHSITGLTNTEYRLKEKFLLRKVEIRDVDDTEEIRYSFEIVAKDQPSCVLYCKSEEEKSEWMAILMTLHLRSTLDRMLDAILAEEEDSTQYRWTVPDNYCFAQEDSEVNLVFEEGQEDDSNIPIIKGGTLLKLVERLTYHKYADPTFVRVFLTTYRSFCKPEEFLNLLMQRYEIPEPPPSEKDRMAIERGQPVVREDLKRFKKEFAQPIQLRVLNVIRQWADQHFYDFEREPQLSRKLKDFFDRIVKGKAVKKWVQSINKIIERKRTASMLSPELSFSQPAPAVEWHITQDLEKFDILTLHPLEIARQLTLIESEMFRAVRPSELVGSAWTKSEKEKTSPNALRMIRFSNTVTYWFEKSITEAQNFEERVAVMTRVIDILMVFNELNNFNGMMEVVSAVNSSPIHRLNLTYAELPQKRAQAIEDAIQLADSHSKKYVEKLRSINPPCVPFLGMYLTNILKIEDGNPDFLPNYPEGIINFNKRRKVADITGEIQQYQNQPYNLQAEPTIRAFFEELDPMEGRSEKEMNDYLYETSLQIEPRGVKQPPKFPRQTEFSLKSPGIKPSLKSTTVNRKISTASSLNLSNFSDTMVESPGSPSPFPIRKPHSLSLSDISEPIKFSSNTRPSIGTSGRSVSVGAVYSDGEITPPPRPPSRPPRIPPRQPSVEENHRGSSAGSLWGITEDEPSEPAPVIPPRPTRAFSGASIPPSPLLQPPPSSSPPMVSPSFRRAPPPPPLPLDEAEPPPPVPPRPPKTPGSVGLSDDMYSFDIDISPVSKQPPAVPPKPSKPVR